MKLTYVQYIEGSKEEFSKFVKEYMIFQDYEGKENFRWFKDGRFPVEEGTDFFFLWNHLTNTKSLGFMKYIEIPNNRLKLTIQFDRRYYDESKHAWLLLRARLIESGFIKVDARKPPSYLLEIQKTVETLFHKGCSDQVIADRIGMSVSTVKRIKRDLGLRKRKT